MNLFVMVLERLESIDIEIEKDLPAEVKKRKNIVNELIATEKNYCHSLNVIKEVLSCDLFVSLKSAIGVYRSTNSTKNFHI
jgi:hypothetical protein